MSGRKQSGKAEGKAKKAIPRFKSEQEERSLLSPWLLAHPGRLDAPAAEPPTVGATKR